MRSAQVRTVAKASVGARLLACIACLQVEGFQGFRSRGVAAPLEVVHSLLHVELRGCDEHTSFQSLAMMKSVSRFGSFETTQKTNAYSRTHTHTEECMCTNAY